MLATTLLILVGAVGLIAIQPLLLRAWPRLDYYGPPGFPPRPNVWQRRRTLGEALREAAAALPVPPAPTPDDAAAPLGVEYVRGQPGTSEYAEVRDTFRGHWARQAVGVETSEYHAGRAYRTALAQGMPLEEAQRRRREALRALGGIAPAGWAYDFMADRYRDVATGMTATAAELACRQADLDLQRQLGAASLEQDRALAAARREYDWADRQRADRQR